MNIRIITPFAALLMVAATTTPLIKAGLGVSRAKLQRALGSSFTFTKGADVEGEESYVSTSTDNTSVVRLVGPEGEVMSASFMSLRETANPKAAKQSAKHMTSFINAIVRGGDKWIARTIKTGSKATSWNTGTRIGRIEIELTHSPVGNDHAYVLEVVGVRQD